MAGSPDPADFLPFAHRLADAAGEIIRRYWRKPIAVEQKTDASPVTIADREAEQALRRLIRETYPEHGILGEEYGIERGEAELLWCLDPIDGTKSFITGRPLFGTLISLLQAGRPILGIIDQCVLRERWVGVRGQPSRHDGQAIRTRSCTSIDQAVLFVTTLQMFRAAEDRTAFGRVHDAVRLPMYGGDCYAYGLLAMGFADLVVEAGLSDHDFMALVPVIEGAGGLMTDWQGRALERGSDGRVIAAGDPRVHAEAMELLALDPAPTARRS
jgi:inositol-phosphate phosphatase / L-galactose 1-phosphate phosphatase / histidinol-phosphatase